MPSNQLPPAHDQYQWRMPGLADDGIKHLCHADRLDRWWPQKETVIPLLCDAYDPKAFSVLRNPVVSAIQYIVGHIVVAIANGAELPHNGSKLECMLGGEPLHIFK